jgi:O-antigen/teichoic acid export membrane protein
VTDTGRSVAITLATNIALALLGAATGVLAARILGPTGRGDLAAIQTFPTLLAITAMLGLPEALVFFTARHPERSGRFLGTAMTVALLASVVGVVVGYVAMPTVLAAQRQSIVESARLYLLIIPIFALAGLPYHPLRGRGHFGWWNALRLAPGVCWLAILLGAWIFHVSSPRTLANAFLLALAGTGLIVALVVRRLIRPSYAPDRRLARPLLRFGLPAVVTTFPQALNLRLDQLLMGAILAANLLGLYAAAVAWSAVTAPILSAVGTVVFPRIAQEEDHANRTDVLARSARLSVLICVLTVPLLLVATPVAMTLLFGDRFAAAVPAALVLVVATTIFSFAYVIEEALRGLGRPLDPLRAQLLGAVVTVISLAFLLNRFGIMGAAVASLLGYSAVAVGALYQAQRAAHIPLTALLVPGRSDVADLSRRVRSLLRRGASI